MTIWTRMYFHAIISTGIALAFFASPGKQWLRGQLESRTRAAGVKMVRSLSTDSVNGTSSGRDRGPLLGLSQDPEKDVEEIVSEIKAEVERVKAEQARKKSAAADKAKAS